MPTFELVDPTDLIRNRLQHSLDLAAFGLSASESYKVESLEIPGVSFQLVPVQNNAGDPVSINLDFRTWVISCAFRDFMEAIGPSLEWARKICFLWSHDGEVTLRDAGALTLSSTFSGEEWNTHIVRFAQKFDRMPLPDKLDHLKHVYGLGPFDLSSAILSLNQARNCLAHRAGVVGEVDINDESMNSLFVHWWRLQLTSRGPHGERFLDLPAHVDAGEEVSLRRVKATRAFPVGERIRFTSSELVELATTVLLFAQQIQVSIKALQQARRPTG